MKANGRPAVSDGVGEGVGDVVDVGLDVPGELDPFEGDEHAAAHTTTANTPQKRRIAVKRASGAILIRTECPCASGIPTSVR